MKNAIFIDTWAFRALADAADPAHPACRDLDDRLLAAGVARVTSDYVLDEALTGIRTFAGLPTCGRFLDEIEALADGRLLRIERVTELRFRRAGALYRRLNGKLHRLSFTDCTSFVIMREEKIAWAFTAAAHFDRVGRDLHAVFSPAPDGTARPRPLPFG